jgi:hypothetical protein
MTPDPDNMKAMADDFEPLSHAKVLVSVDQYSTVQYSTVQSTLHYSRVGSVRYPYLTLC